jgi:hypothetical protein
MITRAILSILLVGVLLYAGSEYRRSPAVAFLAILAAIAGIYFAWFPDHATRLAQWAGVGRGVDLVIYIWVCISLLVLLNLHLKLRMQTEKLTALARAIALADVCSNTRAGITRPHRSHSRTRAPASDIAVADERGKAQEPNDPCEVTVVRAGEPAGHSCVPDHTGDHKCIQRDQLARKPLPARDNGPCAEDDGKDHRDEVKLAESADRKLPLALL